MPSLQPPPPLVYDVALDGGGRRKYEENFFSSWPPSNERERERGRGRLEGGGDTSDRRFERVGKKSG